MKNFCRKLKKSQFNRTMKNYLLTLNGKKELRIFLDLNETLIRTGEVNPSLRLKETKELNKFESLCKIISKKLNYFEIVFLTGNSFEYSRRIEEPLGLKNCPEISVTIVSENGLIARNFQKGDLWKAEVKKDYYSKVDEFLKKIKNSKMLREKFYTQGNEIRITLKPIADTFTEQEIIMFKDIANQINLDEVCIIYSHRYYLDIDPKKITIDGKEIEFNGKFFAVRRLIQNHRCFNIAIGDSKSDLPMFEAVVASGGKAFWVKNVNNPDVFPDATVLPFEFAQGVNSLLENLNVIN